jgi:hypothetical protein
MDMSRPEESKRQSERMLPALRQRHRRLDQNQRLVGMAKVSLTLGRLVVGADATVVSHRIRQRPMLAGIESLDALLEMLQRAREVALEDQRLADDEVTQEEVERISRAPGGFQRLLADLADLSRSRDVALCEIGNRHSREHSGQLG